LRLFFIVLLLFSLAACGRAATPPLLELSPAPPTEPVRIDYPPTGAVIYADTIPLAGWAAIPDFTIELVDLDEHVVAQVAVTGADAAWTVELVHGYTGAPTEMLLRATPIVSAEPPIYYTMVTIALAGSAARPAETFGTITFPAEGTSLGGDFIPVTGIASGAPDNTFWVILTTADGAVVDRREVTFYNPQSVDAMPWTTELTTGGYIGPATITAYFTSPEDDQPITATVGITIIPDAG